MPRVCAVADIEFAAFGRSFNLCRDPHRARWSPRLAQTDWLDGFQPEVTTYIAVDRVIPLQTVRSDLQPILTIQPTVLRTHFLFGVGDVGQIDLEVGMTNDDCASHFAESQHNHV